jgi:hypothetical protein
MSIVVFIFLGLIADASVMLYFGWGVIYAAIAGSPFSHIAATGLAGLTIASTLVVLTAAAALPAASHAMYRQSASRAEVIEIEPLRCSIPFEPPSRIVSLPRR